MPQVFISYNRKDEAVVRSLVKDIEALGHDVWFDQKLSGGQVWWNQILEQIRQCDMIVVALSLDSMDSTACQSEYTYADELGKPILPIRLAHDVSTNLLPAVLTQYQIVDYSAQDRDAAFRLARAIDSVPPPKKTRDPLPTPPDMPISYLGRLVELIGDPSPLSYEKQCAIVLELKRGLGDPENAEDAHKLLVKFKKRRDLLAQIGKEVDVLLEGTLEVPSGHDLGAKLPTTKNESAQSDAMTMGQAPTEKPKGEVAADSHSSLANDSTPPLHASKVNSFAALFNYKCYGLNLYVGVGYFVASLLFWLIRSFLGRHGGMQLSSFAIIVVSAVIFVFLCHLIRNNWLLPLSFGVLSVVFKMLFVQLGWIRLSPMLGSRFFFFEFLSAVFMIAGLVLAVRFFGPSLWSFMFGAALLELIAFLVRGKGDMLAIILSFGHGALLGALIFAGLSLHLRSRGFRIANGSILPTGE